MSLSAAISKHTLVMKSTVVLTIACSVFIDQLPPGMREPLYFKDDDERLSFLYGNYITMTNLTDREVERIIKLHISPIFISVHTTNPQLRVRMMANKRAAETLRYLGRVCQRRH